MRAGFLMRVRAASRGVTVAPMPTGHRLLTLSDVFDRQRRDGPPELVFGCRASFPSSGSARGDSRYSLEKTRDSRDSDAKPSPARRSVEGRRGQGVDRGGTDPGRFPREGLGQRGLGTLEDLPRFTRGCPGAVQRPTRPISLQGFSLGPCPACPARFRDDFGRESWGGSEAVASEEVSPHSFPSSTTCFRASRDLFRPASRAPAYFWPCPALSTSR